MARVFISYVHEDEDIAQAVQSLLALTLKLEEEVFLSADQTQVLAGHIWLDRIRNALDSCELLLLVLSERSINRAWVNFEAGAVWLAGKPVIPICIGRLLIEFLPQPYAGMQSVRLPSDAHYLLTSIHYHLGLETAPPLTQWEQRDQHRRLYEREGHVMTAEEVFRIDLLDPYKQLERAFSMWSDVES
jgi:TIR domain